VVRTTTLSPVLAVFESSLFTSSPLTGLIATADVSALVAGLFCSAGSVSGGSCWVAGLFGWLAGDGCCAKREKLAKANRIATSAVPDFMKILRRFPHFRICTFVTRSRGFQRRRKRRAKPGSLRRLLQRMDLNSISSSTAQD
jgi:hypothetical protein